MSAGSVTLLEREDGLSSDLLEQPLNSKDSPPLWALNGLWEIGWCE